MNITSKLNQTAVRWVRGAVDGLGGNAYAAGVEVAVRWESKQELFLDAAGEKQRSSARVYTDGTGLGVSNGLDDYLYLGLLTDLTAAEILNPKIARNAFRVRGSDVSPGMDASQGLRKEWL